MKKTYMKPVCLVIEAVNAQLLAGTGQTTTGVITAADDSGTEPGKLEVGTGGTPMFSKQHTFSPWDTWDDCDTWGE